MSDRVTELAMDSLVDTHKELMALRRKLEDRPGLAMEIRKAIHDWDGNREMQEKFEHSTFVADRLIAYLKPLG